MRRIEGIAYGGGGDDVGIPGAVGHFDIVDRVLLLGRLTEYVAILGRTDET